MLAKEIIARFHGAAAAERALSRTSTTAQGRRARRHPGGDAGAARRWAIGQLLKQAGLAPSTSEALRLIDGAACASTARRSPTRR